MKGIDRLQETHFPALPQADNPIKKSKMKKYNASMQPAKQQQSGSPWGGSNSVQPQAKVTFM